MSEHKAELIEDGSGNVFADLGIDQSDELLVRAQIGYQVYQILKQKNLKQREIANILSTDRTDVSRLMNGHFNRFTVERLIGFLKKLNHKVTLEISRCNENESKENVKSWHTKVTPNVHITFKLPESFTPSYNNIVPYSIAVHSMISPCGWVVGRFGWKGIK